MARTYLLLGSNLGNSLETLNKAAEMICREVGGICGRSSVYETMPWGGVEGNNFYNCVLEVSTGIDPEALLKKLLTIEASLGRVRTENRPEPRTIDIDILFYDQLVLHEPALQIPHPRLHLRRFTMIPLAELAPGFVHPVLNKSMTELLAICDDKLAVKKIMDRKEFLK